MRDESHLNCLRLRRSNEAIRLANATTARERSIRKAWIDQMDREIDAEEKFIGQELTDDELLRELTT